MKEALKNVKKHAWVRLPDGAIATKLTATKVAVVKWPGGERVTQRQRPRRVMRPTTLVDVLLSEEVRP